MNVDACHLLERGQESRTWFRALEPQYLQTPLATAHTRRWLSRYSAGPENPRPFEVLYLTENPLVALWEVEMMFGAPTDPGTVIPHPNRHCTIISVKVQLQEVADLSKVSQQDLLETTVQELTGDWEGYHLRTPRSTVQEPIGIAPTQALGQALFDLPDLEGFRFVSAKLAYHLNLVVFPQKLLPGSRIEFHDPGTGQRHILKRRPRRRGRLR